MDRLPRVIADGPLDRMLTELLANKVELLPWPMSAEQNMEVDAIYTYGHPAVDGAMLDCLPNVRVVSNYGVGVDHIDMDAARARNVPVGNTPGVLDGATADLGFALLMALARRVVEGDRFARSDAFTRYDPGFMLGREVHGSVAGIIGMGRIGRQFAKRARGFDMTVLYHNRKRQSESEELLGVKYRSLDQLLSESDYVVLTAPLNNQTRGLMNADRLARMKRTGMLINIARGPVVDTAALTEALQNGILLGAALDVTDPEPLPRDHPLLSMENVVITPHLGSATVQTRRRMAEISVENLLAGLHGEPLIHAVSPVSR
jgi:glyoxylate reductase